MTQVLRTSRQALSEAGDRCDLAMASDCLRLIDKAGQTLLGVLCGAGRLDDLREHLYRKPRLPGLIDAATLWPLIEFTTPSEDLLPLEVLPFADGEPFPDIHDLDDLALAAMRFPGLAAMTQRLIFNTDGTEGNVLSGMRVPMKMFAHLELDGAKAEAIFLARDFDLDGPWPRADSDQSAEAALQLILDCRRRAIEGAEEAVDQIQHFSCHCDRDEDESYLRLCAEAGEEFFVSLSDFHAAFGGPRTKIGRPLVFLNTCNSNSPDFMDSTTWGLAFHRLGSRAVIATEAPAPDSFASAFSVEFYASLLNRQTVGHSLQTAKWKLLQRWNNPMGLLYTLFGNPDLHIA